MKQYLIFPLILSVVSGCSAVPERLRIFGDRNRTAEPAIAAPSDVAETPLDATEDAAANDTGSPAQGSLGTTVASLGDPAETGLWMDTSLVKEVRPGRVTLAATGKTVEVSLRPLAGSGGSRLSLQAMQALGVSPTDLPEVEVFAGT